MCAGHCRPQTANNLILTCIPDVHNAVRAACCYPAAIGGPVTAQQVLLKAVLVPIQHLLTPVQKKQHCTVQLHSLVVLVQQAAQLCLACDFSLKLPSNICNVDHGHAP